MVKAGWIFAVILMAGSAGSPISPAAKKENGKGDMTAGAPIREVLTESQPVFTHEERTRITNWFSNRRGGLPPGLAKRDHLPPGLEKHLQRNGTLPPGLQKKVQDLPDGLERQLRMLPTGYRRVVIAGNVILMNEKTALVYDIVRNVIP